MSFHVVYKWKHEEVINHKAWNVLCEKGKKGEDEVIKRHLALKFVYTHCHWTIRSLLLASSKREQRWRWKKMSFIWTRNRTWFFIRFQFLIFIPFHGFEYLCNKSEHRKAQASLLLLPSLLHVVDVDFLFVIEQISKILLCWASIVCKRWFDSR